MSTPEHFDAIVVGGGLIGSAVAFGLARKRLKVAILDEGDDAYRAARGNFGLVWIQSKGSTHRPYAVLSREAGRLWPEFARELRAVSGIDVGLQQDGGLTFCLSERDLEQRAELMRHQFDADLPHTGAYEILSRTALEKLCPGIGPDVVGASYSRLDGSINPLRFLRALHAACRRLGVDHRPGAKVSHVATSSDRFTVEAGAYRVTGDRLVLAAGLGNKELARHIGLETPVRAERGQILVTEKLPPLLNIATYLLRQMDEGGFIVGDSHEDVGLSDATALPVMRTIAQHAVSCFPALGRALVIRAWSCLRVMAPDGLPLYQQSPLNRFGFAFSAHSGVTLGPTHAFHLAEAVHEGRMCEKLLPFTSTHHAIQDSRSQRIRAAAL